MDSSISRSNQLNKIQCKYHPNSHLIEDYKAGDLICTECGLVVVERAIDFSNEWRSFADDGEDRSRVGMTEGVNHIEGSSSVGIKFSNDARHLDEDGNQKYKQRNLVTPNERLMRSCSDQVRKIGDRLNANSNIQKSALSYIKKLTDGALHKRKTRHEVLASAALYYAFKSLNVPRTIKEICEVSDVSKKEIHKVSKRIKLVCPEESVINKGSDYVLRFVSQLDNLTNVQKMKLENLAKIIADLSLENKTLVGKSPVSLSATAIYMASLILKYPEVRKSKIADICLCSEVTISGLYKTFFQYRFDLVPKSSCLEYYPALHELGDKE